MDISAAFLKGMTYEKIAEMTGEPLRSVQFDFQDTMHGYYNNYQGCQITIITQKCWT